MSWALTIKELKEILSAFDDRLFVFSVDGEGYSPVIHVSQGVNEADGFIFLDHYEDDE